MVWMESCVTCNSKIIILIKIGALTNYLASLRQIMSRKMPKTLATSKPIRMWIDGKCFNIKCLKDLKKKSSKDSKVVGNCFVLNTKFCYYYLIIFFSWSRCYSWPNWSFKWYKSWTNSIISKKWRGTVLYKFWIA